GSAFPPTPSRRICGGHCWSCAQRCLRRSRRGRAARRKTKRAALRPPSSFRMARSLTGRLLRRELEVRRGGADFGVDLGFELGKVLLEHADQRTRGLVELGLVLPGVD